MKTKHSEESKLRISSSQKGIIRGPYKGSALFDVVSIPDEKIKSVISSSASFRESLLKLGLTSRHYYAYSKFIKSKKFDVAHFLGQSANSCLRFKGGSPKRKAEEFLILREKKYSNTSHLKDLLLEIGREYVCDECGQDGNWNSKYLRLHVDHIDCNRCDDRETNLRFLCPNCHSQTETYAGRNKNKHA